MSVLRRVRTDGTNISTVDIFTTLNGGGGFDLESFIWGILVSSLIQETGYILDQRMSIMIS